ncbi:MAG: DUF4058 family protein, partial [Chloroflexota bacterium]
NVNFDYAAAAAAVSVEAGVPVIDDRPEMEALYIYSMDDHDLVTVIEIVSPRNKSHLQDIHTYVEQRRRVFLSQGIYVVEIDATRSTQHLVNLSTLQTPDYHIAIHIPGDLSRVIPWGFGEVIPRFALPLREAVIPVTTHTAYEAAYRTGGIAGNVLSGGHYAADALPFPSTLTAEERSAALVAVAAWEEMLKTLRDATDEL